MNQKPRPRPAKLIRCSICFGELGDPWGNNAEPVNAGRCCANCNFRVVIPARIRIVTNRARK